METIHRPKILRVGTIIVKESGYVFDNWSWDFEGVPTPFDSLGNYQYPEDTIYGYSLEELLAMQEAHEEMIVNIEAGSISAGPC